MDDRAITTASPPFYRWGNRIGLAMALDCPGWADWTKHMLERPAVSKIIGIEGISQFDYVEMEIAARGASAAAAAVAIVGPHRALSALVVGSDFTLSHGGE